MTGHTADLLRHENFVVLNVGFHCTDLQISTHGNRKPLSVQQRALSLQTGFRPIPIALIDHVNCRIDSEYSKRIVPARNDMTLFV